MLRTNKDKLPVVAVQGQVWQSKAYTTITPDGEVAWLQGTGGITYNAQVGDPCTGWVADHLEPGVSTRNSDDKKNEGYNVFSCVGNVAEVKSGDAKGAKGFVIGKHGGAEHVMVHFAPQVLEELCIDDRIAVRASGQGLKLLDYPGIVLRNMSPALLEKMSIEEEAGSIRVGVAKIIPGALMGSGVGMDRPASGDYDVTLFDEELARQHGLFDLRFGDIVAVTNSDTRFGRIYRTGAVTIGVVIHSDSPTTGHGPGITTLMSSKTELIKPFLDESANLKTYFVEE